MPIRSKEYGGIKNMKIFYFCDKTFLDMKENFEKSFKDDFQKKFSFVQNINIKVKS